MFNLFQRTDEPTIICALPDGGRIPRFLRSEGWTYHCKVDDIRDEQFQCDRPWVEAVIDRNGFYVYARI